MGLGHLIGIVSRADVLSVYARPDDDIWREVTDQVILGSFLVDPARFDVAVQSGIVTLSGRPETDQVGHEIVDAVSHVQGRGHGPGSAGICGRSISPASILMIRQPQVPPSELDGASR